MGPYWRNLGVYENVKYVDEKHVSFYLNDLKRTGISDVRKNGTRITLVEQPPFVGLNHS